MPGCTLPLHIFEPRYRALLEDVTADGGPGHFGVVVITPDRAVAEPEVAADYEPIGTLAQVLEVHPGPGGTSAVLTGGTRRFRVHRIVDSPSPYLEAEISYLEEAAGTMPPNLPDATKALATEYSRLISVLTGGETGARDPYPDDDILLSYRLASEVPLPTEDRQRLLEDEDAAIRLLHVRKVLRREVALLRHTRTIAVSPAVLQIALRPG
jgi:Lon protease-like protein